MKGSLENDNGQYKRIVSQIWLNEGMNPWPLPAQFILLKTGCHCCVVTYDPQSSFMSLPGPQFRRRMCRASVILRSNFGFFFLSSDVHSIFGPSILALHFSICWVRPECDHRCCCAALRCSESRIRKLLFVSPT